MTVDMGARKRARRARKIAVTNSLYINPKQYVVTGATPGVDAYSLIMTQVNICKTNGGGTILLPYIGGTGYSISQTIVVDFDNCTILLDDNVTLTKTDPTNLVGPDAVNSTGVNGCGVTAFLFAGRLTGPSQNRYYIKNPQLIGLKKVTIDANGLNASSNYTYVVGQSGAHSCVVFSGTINGLISNLYTKNGLVYCINTTYSPELMVDNCTADTTQYDNGIQVVGNREHILAYSDTDPNTWANVTFRDCVAKRCRNHGIGTYGSTALTIINPLVINCGNNGPARQTGGVITDAGPAGGINYEHDGINTSRNYRGTIINPRVYNSWGFGIRTNQVGLKIIGPRVYGTKVPTDTTYVANDTNIWGSAIFVQGAGTVEIIDPDIDGSDKYGLNMGVSGTLYPSAKIVGGKFTNCQISAIVGRGINRLAVSNTTLFETNGNTSNTTAGSQYTIDISNAANNTSNGICQIAGRFDNNQGGIATVTSVGDVDLTKGISGKNNGLIWTTAYHLLYTQLPQVLSVANIAHTDNNSKIARLVFCQQAAIANVDYESVIGNQTSTTKALIEIAALTSAYYGNQSRKVIYSGGVSSYTPNSFITSKITFGSPYINQNLTINADTPTITPYDGQRLIFTLIQDATGGRTVSWNAAYKAVTLASSGTANQKAVIEFMYTGSSWVQTMCTGWYS